jgi:pimeloyl-ACP methyl ester carboxylesterase
MGGLVAMMAAARRTPEALVVIEPSLPLDLLPERVGDAPGAAPGAAPRVGTYDAADEYGPPEPRTRHRPESTFALDERRRGISVPHLRCPVLVVAGRSYVDVRGRPVAEHYGAELLELPHLGHADLVRDETAVRAVMAWVRRAAGRDAPGRPAT